MASLKQIRDKADVKLVDFWNALSAKQEQYFQKHGKYFQLLVTQSVVDGADTTFELIKPNDERHPLDVDFTFNSPIPFQIRVDEWNGGNERGYTATVVVELLNGDKYTRSRSLTDTRKKIRVYENNDPEGALISESWEGDVTIETTSWEQIIEEQL